MLSEDDAAREAADLELRTGPPTLSTGGPFIGFGSSIGHGFRTRLGWEFGITTRLISSLSIETNFSSSVSSALVGELVGASPWHVPWWGIGAGPIVVSDGERRLGGRAQFQVHLFLIGMTLAADFFRDSKPTISLFGTLAF